MNILIVSSYLPYPLYSGGYIRLYNLIKQLSKKHTITLVCEKRPNQTAADEKEIAKFCKRIITVSRQKQWSIQNIFKTGFSLNPFLITGHTHNEMHDIIQSQLETEKFDVIHVETFYVLQNVPDTQIPIVLVEHNIEYQVYARFMRTAPVMLRPLLSVDVMKLKRKEEAAWQRATRLVAVSEDEKEIMVKVETQNVTSLQDTRISVVPNGVDTEMFTFKKSQKKEYRSVTKHMTLPEKELLFIGDFKWIQNRDTARWLIQDIWPFLLRSVDGEVKIKLRIVGRNIPQKIKSMNIYDSILFDENSPKKTPEIFQQADILLTPIRVGGGTSYKIIEAMASGVPVVTTRLGAEGLHVVDGENIVVADDVQSIVEKTARILRDQEYYDAIAKNARETIEREYDWNKIAKKLDEVYESVTRK